ncbi:hypothetical protein FE394_00590 [Xenorhabdus sp. Reich]|uniref:Uncharacterized protein n=1 Tax=Xenorhabdus littoralis TaxID=2582835 RepID=A0ABU4SGE5_9GAMM|nr:hypothetical protein [Xenorhabdus sp. Reich]MDX7997731.1 hypothetical protein [Xenorhabdus sp. Reich]
MYYILGYKSIIQSMNDSICLHPYLYHSYDDFIKNKSVFSVIPNKKFPVFTSYKEGLKFCQNHLISLKDKFSENTEKIENMIKNKIFYEWFDTLKDHDEIYTLINKIIKLVIINKLSSYTNGTTKNSIGLACIDFKDNFSKQDFLELIFHQLIHMVLFIDDIASSHMKEDDKLITVEVEGIKSIFNDNKFPIYTLFHSYIVGVEIFNYRSELFGIKSNSTYHGTTERIIKLCQTMAISIEKNIFLFSNRAKDIFNLSKKLMPYTNN